MGLPDLLLDRLDEEPADLRRPKLIPRECRGLILDDEETDVVLEVIDRNAV